MRWVAALGAADKKIPIPRPHAFVVSSDQPSMPSFEPIPVCRGERGHFHRYPQVSKTQRRVPKETFHEPLGKTSSRPCLGCAHFSPGNPELNGSIGGEIAQGFLQGEADDIQDPMECPTLEAAVEVAVAEFGDEGSNPD